ncbi:hypothetical protein HY58_02075 [Flavihumibacter sp. ZG627]|nr:hypothetical protein HY58_02075 [Flavihumibacter sp. ZG627]
MIEIIYKLKVVGRRDAFFAAGIKLQIESGRKAGCNLLLIEIIYKLKVAGSWDAFLLLGLNYKLKVAGMEGWRVGGMESIHFGKNLFRIDIAYCLLPTAFWQLTFGNCLLPIG